MTFNDANLLLLFTKVLLILSKSIRYDQIMTSNTVQVNLFRCLFD